MKGTIFTLFEDFVVETFGADAYEEILAATPLVTKEPFVGPLTYPAEDLMALVTTTVTRLDIPVEDALRAFGRFAFPVLAASIPSLMGALPDARSFLVRLESLVHTEVRKLDPVASPPRLTVVADDGESVVLRYESPYGLFALVEGFVDAVGVWYDTPLRHERVAVEGTHATFRIHLPPAAVVPAQSPATRRSARATA